MTFTPGDLTHDQFLGGKLTISQPKIGYRAGIDPVLLAAATPARPGQSVLELGCGAGAASLCLATRVAELDLYGVEFQPDYADLAMKNAADNAINMCVHICDLRNLSNDLRQRQFDHVIANPPYYQRDSGTASSEVGRDLALAGDTPLADWITTAARRLMPKGVLSIVQDIRRLPDLMTRLQTTDLGSVEVLPIAARQGRAPHLLLLRARKGGRAQFMLYAPLIMHEGAHHVADGDSYTAELSSILRGGAALNFPGQPQRG